MSRMGRPPLPTRHKDTLVRKLEPYLKAGLSIRKACLQSGVSRSQVNYWISRDSDFSDQIHRFKQYLSVMLNSALCRELMGVVRKQNDNRELEWNDRRFLMWYALNSTLARQEFGRRIKMEAYDPEVEIARIGRMIDEAVTLNN